MPRKQKKVRCQSSKLPKKQIPPTGSTFVNFGTCRKICNLGGYKNEEYFFNTHKKKHGTFGFIKNGYRPKSIKNGYYSNLPKIDKNKKKKKSLYS